MFRVLTPTAAVFFVVGFASALHAQVSGNPIHNGHGVISRLAAYESVVHPDHGASHPANDAHAYSEDGVDFHDYHCDHCSSHDHGHGHDDHVFDYLRPFHHRHETACGYPIFEMLRTDHAFIDRKIRADFVHSANADGGEVHESEFEFELFWAINNRIAWFVEFPVIVLDPRSDPNTSGIGDLEVGFRFVAFDGEYDIVTFGLNATTPTGDPDRDLGAGHTSLEPVFCGGTTSAADGSCKAKLPGRYPLTSTMPKTRCTTTSHSARRSWEPAIGGSSAT